MLERMRRLKWLILLLMIGYFLWAFFRPLPPVSASLNLPQAKNQPINLAWPSQGEAAIGAVNLGILDSWGKSQAVPVASTVKLLTALAVLQKKPLEPGQDGPSLIIGANDVAAYLSYVSQDGSAVRVIQGEKLTEHQALEALLLPSANNIAYSLAVWAFGSINNFLNFTNNYARSLGLESTKLADASGFSPQTKSTAVDLTQLGLSALQNPVIAALTSQKSAVLPVVGRVYNVNFALGSGSIIGIKTGNTDQAGGCFVFAARRNLAGQSLTVVGAVTSQSSLLGALDSGERLANSAFSTFQSYSIHQGDILGNYQTGWSGPVPIIAGGNLTSLGWPDKSKLFGAHLAALPLSAPKDQMIGTLQALSGKNALTNLLLIGPVRPPSLLWRLTHPLR